MIESKAIRGYEGAINSYGSFDINTKLKGVLVEKDGKNLKLRLEDKTLLKVELREDIDVKPNTTVLIERSNVEKSKTIDSREDVSLSKSETEKLIGLLKSFNADVTEENLMSLKKMDNLGIELSEENFNTYRIAKNSLEEVALSLDYETAIMLEELGLDIENDSVEKIASALKDIRLEREASKVLNLFDSPQLSTEEAEIIANKIYASNMGRDITDIIKTLHKNGVNITKENIDKIDSSFYKLHKLKDLEESSIIDALKDELDINIDNLYRVKMYQVLNSQNAQSDKEPPLADQEITSQVIDIKTSLVDIIENMNYDRASVLVEQVDIEMEDIRSLSNKLQNIPNDKVFSNSPPDLEGNISTLVKSDSLSSIASALSDIGELEFDAVAIAIKKFSSISLLNLHKICSSSEYREIQLSHFSQSNDDSDFKTDLSKAFSRNGVEYSRPNIEKAVDIYRGYNNIKNNINENITSKALIDNIRLESIEISEASKYIDRYIQAEQNYGTSKLRDFNSLNSVFKNGDNSSIMAIRGQELLSLGELKKADSLFKNNNQIGQKLSEISSIISAEDTSDSVDILKKIREGILAVQRGLKTGKSDVEIGHQKLQESIEDLSSLASKDGSNLGDTSKQASDMISESKEKLSNDRILQLPVMLNDQLTNLNMYFKEKKNNRKSSSGDSFSAILSIETSSLGTLNIGVDIERQSVSLKINAENNEHKSQLEKYLSSLNDKISQTDYSLSELTLRSDSEVKLFDETMDSSMRLLPSLGNLDIKV